MGALHNRMVAVRLHGWKIAIFAGWAIISLTSPSLCQSVRGPTFAPPKEEDDSTESPDANPSRGSEEGEDSTGSTETSVQTRSDPISVAPPGASPPNTPAPSAGDSKAPPPAPTTAAPDAGSSGMPASAATPARVVTRCGGPKSKPRKAPNGIDAIDLRKAAIAKGVNIADWPITSALGGISIGGRKVCTPHSMSGRWPKLNFFGDPNTKVEGNMWMFAYLDGRWVGGAGHWLRPGQTCKEGNLNAVGPDVYYDSEPLRSWSPCHGELVGFAVSTPARAGQWGRAERSNVIIVTWP